MNTGSRKAFLVITAMLVVACDDTPREDPTPLFTAIGDVIAVPVIHSERDETEDGRVARVDLHVLFPASIDQPAARATLQHLIDSVAADSAVSGVRVTGFMLGELDPLTGEAEAQPAVTAIWAPIDTIGFTHRTSRTRFRTSFTMLRSLPTGRRP